MCLIFHRCKSDIFIEVGLISSITSCNTPTTMNKVHNLNAIKIAVKIAGIVLSSREKKIPMTIKPSMAIAPKTMPTIKATLWRLMEPKRSTESMIKSMAKMIAAAMKSAQKIAPRSWQGWKWKAPLNIMKRYFDILLSNYLPCDPDRPIIYRERQVYWWARCFLKQCWLC